jgi:hypothetical protein
MISDVPALSGCPSCCAPHRLHSQASLAGSVLQFLYPVGELRQVTKGGGESH